MVNASPVRFDVPRIAAPELFLARALVVLVPVQILIAFLGVPRVAHWILGGVIGVLALGLMLLLRRTGSASNDLRRLSLGLVIDLGLQPLLLLVGNYVPAVQGLHGINGIIAFGLAILVAIESEESKPQQRP